MAIDFSKSLKDQDFVEGGGTPGFKDQKSIGIISNLSPGELKQHFEGLDRYAFGMTAYSF